MRALSPLSIGLRTRPISLAARAMVEIKRYGGTLLLPRPRGNYLDSAGTTPATIDNPDGLVLDAAGVVGPELNPDTGFANPAGWSVSGSDATHIVTFSGGTVRYQSGLTTPSMTVQAPAGVMPPGTYEVTATCSNWVSGSIKVFESAAGRLVVDKAGTVSTILTTTIDLPLIFYRNSENVDLTLSFLGMKRISGSHASQPTTGSKPTLRRGLLNQLLWSGDFTNAAWNKTGSSVATGQPDPSGGTTGFKLVESAANSQHYFLQNAVSGAGAASMAYIVKAAGRTKVRVRSEGPQTLGLATNFDLAAGSVASGSGSMLPLGNGFYLCVANSTGNGSGASGYHLIQPTDNSWSETYTGDGTSGVIVYRAGLYRGTVTAQQIIDAGGIPLTTTAAASAANGKTWWQFDLAAPGDFFGTGITTGEAGWICAGVTPANTTTGMSIANAGEGTTTIPGVWLFASGGGSWVASAANGSNRPQAVLPMRGAVPQVVSMGWDASSISVGVDLTEASTPRTGNCASGANTLRIGMYQGSSIPFNGGMSAQVICPVMPPPAVRALIRKYIGSLQGQTL